MRSSSQQFHLFTRQEAAVYLARASMMAESYDDRVAAWRRLMPVTTAAEREASRAYTERAALKRFRKLLTGEWPEHGPIIVREPEGP